MIVWFRRVSFLQVLPSSFSFKIRLLKCLNIPSLAKNQKNHAASRSFVKSHLLAVKEKGECPPLVWSIIPDL